MMRRRPPNRSLGARIGGGIAAAIAGLGLIAAVVVGLRVSGVVEAGGALDVFDVAIPPPPPPAPVPAAEPVMGEAEGAAAPPALRARPKAVVAPPVPRPRPAPIAAPPIAGEGNQASAGASDRAGPGTGAGGSGNGTGSGGTGTGTGSGGGGLKRVAGSISNRDYPASAYRAGAGGRVIVTLDVDARGRVTGCAVMRSSGTQALDDATCTLARKRFRYTPARDADGRAVAGQAGYRQDWWLEGQARPPE
ncbi:energy transducer TonB [Sphingomonas sp. CJ99]